MYPAFQHPGPMARAFSDRSLAGLGMELAGLDAELGALERHLGDLGAGAALATGAAASGATLVGGGIALSAGTGAGVGGAALATSFIGGTAVGSAAGLAVIGAPVAAVGVTAAVLASWRATSGNVKRLKSKIKELESKIRVTKRTLSKSQPRTAKRRIWAYTVQINMAKKRLRRIERVMKRRIDRRTGKGKELTARQQRLVGALNLNKKKKPQVAPVAQARLQEQAFVGMGGPAVPRGLSPAAVKTYVDRVLPEAQRALQLGVGVDQATQMGMSQVQVPEMYQQIVARRVHFWLSRRAVPGRFQPAGQAATFAPSAAAVGGSYYDQTQSGAFQPFPNGMVPQGGGALMAMQNADQGPVSAEEAELVGDDAGDDAGALGDESPPFYKNPKLWLALAIGGGALWYFNDKKKGARGAKGAA